MKILAIETSTRNSSIAISDGDTILAEWKSIDRLSASRDLVPNIDAALKRVGWILGDIDSFAISIGPGSFTGLRVGVAILKGLNLVTETPIVAVPTLDVIAQNAGETNLPICVIVDAKKKNLYSSLYRRKGSGIIRDWEYTLLSPEELVKRCAGETFFLGDGIGQYGEHIKKTLSGARLADEALWYPDVKNVARLGLEKGEKGEFTEPDKLAPLYIYSEECNVRGIDR